MEIVGTAKHLFQQKFQKNCLISKGIPNLEVWWKKWSNWTYGVREKKVVGWQMHCWRSTDPALSNTATVQWWLTTIGLEINDSKCELLIISRAQSRHWHADIYQLMWRCCWQIVSAKSAIFAHKSVALLLCMECWETQVSASSLTLTDYYANALSCS